MSNNDKNALECNTSLTLKGSAAKKSNPAACIFVASLNKNVQDKELNESVYTQFKQWGKLLEVKVLRDWMGRPYAFVQFESVEDSQKALQESQGKILLGRNIRCESARVNRTLCLVSNRSSFDISYLKSRLSMFGEIEDILVPPHHIFKFNLAFVRFHYRDDAIQAFSALKRPEFPQPWLVHWTSNVDMNNISSMMNERQYLDKQSLFIGNLPESASEERLREIFCQYGTIVYIRIIRKYRQDDKRVFGFIKYQFEPEAMIAIQQENGRIWQDSKLYVCHRKCSFRQRITHQMMNPSYNPYYYMFTNLVEMTSSNKDVSQILPFEYCYSPYGYYIDNPSSVYYMYPKQY